MNESEPSSPGTPTGAVTRAIAAMALTYHRSKRLTQ